MRRILLLLFPVLTVVGVIGCPLDIQVRCDENSPCHGDEACVAGACVRIPPEKIGEACTADSECGAGLSCGTGFPGGYCLALCGPSGACPSGAVCVPELGRCLRACGEACTRPGYACLAVPHPSSLTQACAPASESTGDGGTGDGGPTEEPSTCSTDLECPEDRRCSETWHTCELGPRLGEACEDSFDCGLSGSCNPQRSRCEKTCSQDLYCPNGYRCSPDELCVEKCSSAPPETVGLTCETSMDCARCGFCVDSGGVKQCRQPCQLDRDCPGGATGVCERVGSTQLKACRLP